MFLIQLQLVKTTTNSNNSILSIIQVNPFLGVHLTCMFLDYGGKLENPESSGRTSQTPHRKAPDSNSNSQPSCCETTMLTTARTQCRNTVHNTLNILNEFDESWLSCKLNYENGEGTVFKVLLLILPSIPLFSSSFSSSHRQEARFPLRGPVLFLCSPRMATAARALPSRSRDVAHPRVRLAAHCSQMLLELKRQARSSRRDSAEPGAKRSPKEPRGAIGWLTRHHAQDERAHGRQDLKSCAPSIRTLFPTVDFSTQWLLLLLFLIPRHLLCSSPDKNPPPSTSTPLAPV